MMDWIKKTLAFSLLLGGAFAKDFPVTSNYVLRHIESCPDVGYYFRREPTPNQLGPGACFLCFCQENSTAVCWPRERSRCDVEMFHHHRVGRNTRVRRSPTGLGDIFFRDATRTFFDTQLPKVCKPNVSSFSGGCPPADWCLGCTVCDCDANGQWDCHILSFCNKDVKKKVPKRKVPMPTRRVYHNSPPKKEDINKPNKIVKNNNKSKQVERRKRNNVVKKPTNNKNNSNRQNQNKKPNSRKSHPKPKPKLKPKKLQQKRIKKQIHQKTSTRTPIKKQSNQSSRKPKRKFLRINEKKVTSTATPMVLTDQEVTKVMAAKTSDAQTLLGRQIVRKVMETVQKIMNREERKKAATNARVQRSADAKNDCPKMKKNKQKKSKSRRKNRYDYKRRNYNKNDWLSRKKREAFDLNLSIMEHSDDNIVNKDPKDKEKKIESLVKRITKNVTANIGDNSTDTSITTISTVTAYISAISQNNQPISNITADNILYYKYSVDDNVTKSSIATKNEQKTVLNQQNRSLSVTKGNAKNIINQSKERIDYAILMNDPEYNDLKNKKWEVKKMSKKNNKIYNLLQLNLNNKGVNTSDISKQLKSKVHRKDVERKINLIKNNNLKKIIAKNLKTPYVMYPGNDSQATGMNHNITGLHDLLQKLMNELPRKNSTQAKLKHKFSLFTYLRSILKKTFSHRKNSHLIHKTNEGHTLEILCDNIGACYQNKHNRISLRSKLHDLNAETKKIFRTIKTIKGLLSLIDLPDIKIIKKEPMNKDLVKLDAILKGTYMVGQNSTLSETVAAQVTYVKQNIHQFIESVNKFATILNEVIDVLFKNNKKYASQQTVLLNKKKRKLNSYDKIKELLLKYNFLQNSFMKNMYKLLTDIEKKKNKKPESLKPKVSKIDINNSQIINEYSKNIIENLRKLNNLAKALNSNRRKRQTMREDDAIEYLLVLMEYLLKQNHPLDTAPVNDGIDLLIEAIQNAPNIKQIKKKVLEYIPTISPVTRTTSIDLNYIKEDSISDSKKISKEEVSASKNENDLAIVVEQSADEEQITQVVYYKKFDDDNTTVYNEIDVTSEHTIDKKSEKAEINENLEESSFDRVETTIGDTRRYDIFPTDLEDEGVIPVIVSTTANSITTTAINEKLSNTENASIEETTFIALHNYKLDDDIPADENRTKLDWIEENFGKEIREYGEDNTDFTNETSQLVTPTITTTTVTATIAKDKGTDNISSITVELEDEEKKKKSKEAADEVLYRKQIAFLNSLDYGTERSDFDNSESKDDERFSSDSFSSYFIR